MKKFKKIVCMLLIGAMVLAPAAFSLASNAAGNEPPPLKVEITTDKDSYGTYSTANFTVKVTNISNETVSNGQF